MQVGNSLSSGPLAALFGGGNFLHVLELRTCSCCGVLTRLPLTSHPRTHSRQLLVALLAASKAGAHSCLHMRRERCRLVPATGCCRMANTTVGGNRRASCSARARAGQNKQTRTKTHVVASSSFRIAISSAENNWGTRIFIRQG